MQKISELDTKKEYILILNICISGDFVSLIVDVLILWKQCPTLNFCFLNYSVWYEVFQF